MIETRKVPVRNSITGEIVDYMYLPTKGGPATSTLSGKSSNREPITKEMIAERHPDIAKGFRDEGITFGKILGEKAALDKATLEKKRVEPPKVNLSIEEQAKREWDASPKLQREFMSFGGYVAIRKEESSEQMVSEFQKKEGCDYRTALLAVSERHPGLIR